MTLRERLEAVWRDKHLACPCHIVKWSEIADGYQTFCEYKLYYKKGHKVKLKASRKRNAHK